MLLEAVLDLYLSLNHSQSLNHSISLQNMLPFCKILMINHNLLSVQEYLLQASMFQYIRQFNFSNYSGYILFLNVCDSSDF